nr:type II toxin-antitoxin system RelB/DinJ family antitoxin [uncultured Ruminobacter sp.]
MLSLIVKHTANPIQNNYNSYTIHIQFTKNRKKEITINSSTVNYSFRVDREIKRQCEAIFNELGMNLTTAINIFLRQSLRVGGIPFDVRIDQPNKETIAAMLEAEGLAKDPNAKRYSDVDKALTALKE